MTPHTKAKHDLLRYYLDAWFAIMASSGFRRRIVYIDGFAGPGSYEGGEVGSPILALTRLLDHAHFSRWSKTEFVFTLFEPESDRFADLEATLAQFFADRGGTPPNVTVHKAQTLFEDGAERILQSIQDRKLAPTFAFVDPFSYKGVPIELISRLLAYDTCEVFINFMYNEINRFVTAPHVGVDHNFVELFGCDLHRNAPPAGNPERREYLVDLYTEQLRTKGGFPYVRSFEIWGKTDRVAYDMFYGTRHTAGLKAMKAAMWKVDPAGGHRFFEKLKLTPDEIDPKELFDQVTTRFAGQRVSIHELEQFVLVETNYRTEHLRPLVLRPMENAGMIAVERTGPQFPPGTHITFL